MLDQAMQFYLTNYAFQGITNLILVFGTLTLTTLILLGPEKKQPEDHRHPLFGRYTRQIPNIISLMRFPLGLWIFCVHYFPALHHPLANFSFHLSFALICILDNLDGKFARKWNAVTEDGKALDPAADKWVTFCLAVTAYLYGDFRWWGVIIIFGREIISMLQRVRLKRRGEDVGAKWMGKIKAGVQFTVLYIFLLRVDMLPGTIFLEVIAQAFPDNMMLWGTILLCFCTMISLFPFFRSFSYVNAYTQSQRKESNKPWYIVMIPNLFTLGNYLCGVTAVFFAMPEVEVQHRSFVVLFWIMSAALCDAFDGPLARKLKAHSEFGAALDSSTDLSTFGLATAVIIYLRFSELKGALSHLGIVLAIVYFIYVHLRLAYFTKLAEQKEDKSVKSDFVGMPSPTGAVSVLVAFTFFENIYLLASSIVLISLLMYSKLDFISHSNSLKHKLYKYFQIPTMLAGFTMLLVLIFQQPFVSSHFSRELIVYFHLCSWLLAVPIGIYILDACYRTYFTVKNGVD
ncbi:MAG: CDP-alcohol phosphatidyltransferase family protein [Proteobacteria bacterium]|nr:CDP-alcohol phosphatidyltransferase family protein [Pseudomonadota bacterium]MBU1737413.1 CDP-alcohol phosphatidyltransferase family protein [Pseudomonadota bacterium]